MDESEKADLEVKGFSLVDVSHENDSLISAPSSSSFLIDLQSLENQNEPRSPELLDAVKAEETIDNLGPEQYEPLEPERTRRSGKCNLRKSLAWDSAFFTSAGVLDPEELSSIIEGVEKSGRNLLPGIEEDIHRSTDSISTLESESLTLDVLEADLFEDIRASIQNSSKAYNMTSSSCKSTQEKENQALCSSKKLDLPSPNTMKAKSAPKKHPIVVKDQGRLIKQGSGCPQAMQMKPIPRNGDSSSSLPKAPKLIGRANPISVAPTKRASLGANRVKMENDNVKGNTVSNKGVLASRTPSLGGSRRGLPKPAPSSKSSYMGSSTVTKTESTRSSSCDSSASTSSDNIGRSPLNVRRKTDSRTVNPHSSSSMLKTPSNISLKNKTQSGKPGLSAHLMSSKPSSSISPASSISDWSSESSSSVSTVNQRSNKLRISLDSSSSRRSAEGHIPPLDLQKLSIDQVSDEAENQVTGPHSEDAKKTTGLRQAPTKPTGLRMPSPKIGFFDGVKSLVRTPNGGMKSHSGLSTGLPKVGSGICSPNGDLNKPKLGKLQSAIAVSANRGSNASIKISSASRGVKNSSKISPKVLNKTSGESGQSIKDVGTETDKHVPDPGLDAEKNGSISGLKDKQSFEMQGNAVLKDNKVTSIERDICDSTSICTIKNMNSSQKVGEDANYGEYQLQDNLSNPSLLSVSPTILEVTAGARTPFAVKNSFCNDEGLVFSTGLSLEEVEKKTTALPSSETSQKENC